MRPLPNRSGTMPGAAMKKTSPEPQRHDARRRHEEDEACGREKPAGIAEIHFLAGDGLFPDEPAP